MPLVNISQLAIALVTILLIAVIFVHIIAPNTECVKHNILFGKVLHDVSADLTVDNISWKSGVTSTMQFFLSPSLSESGYMLDGAMTLGIAQ